MGLHDRDQLDELLDGALRQYGGVEPRPGLEGRVLARMAAGENSHPRKWWTWTFAGASAVVLAALWIVSGARTARAPRLAVRGTPAVAAITSNRQSVAPIAKAIVKATASLPPTRRHKQLAAVRHLEPRLDHFPSEREPNSEERLLVNYVEQFPEEARLMAREQQRFEDETRKIEQEFERQQER